MKLLRVSGKSTKACTVDACNDTVDTVQINGDSYIKHRVAALKGVALLEPEGAEIDVPTPLPTAFADCLVFGKPIYVCAMNDDGSVAGMTATDLRRAAQNRPPPLEGMRPTIPRLDSVNNIYTQQCATQVDEMDSDVDDAASDTSSEDSAPNMDDDDDDDDDETYNVSEEEEEHEF